MSRPAQYRFLAAGLLINALLGVLYAWSLFLLPIEALLERGRGAISVAPSVALLSFTVGVYVHDDLLRRIPVASLAGSALAVAGGGYLLFWLAPSYVTLVLGYGVLFGLAGGVGFGTSLALARATISPPSGWLVGLVAATFAASGMSIAALGAGLGVLDPVSAFGGIGAAFIIGAGAVALVLRGRVYPARPPRRAGEHVAETRTLGFWCLFVGNFTMCYAGLMFISHGAALLTSFGLAPAKASWAPFASNIGYVFGALFGGVIAARFTGRSTPLGFSLGTLIAAATFIVPGVIALKFLGLMVIGAALGGTVSVFMMLFAVWYGADRAGLLFSRLNVGYGLAGFVAPSTTGWLYDRTDGYHVAIVTCVALSLIGTLAIAVSPRPRRS